MDLAIALRAFVRTVERGSVTGAARDLAVSQPAVTKHLRNLERHVGARLLERSSRIVRPTPQGQALYEASRSALASIDSALEGVRRDMGAIEGPLRIHAPACLGAKRLHPIVMAFQAEHPAVTVDLVLENRNVDLVYENFDLAVKYGRPEGQELIIRRLGLVRRILVASPDFLARVGPVDPLERLSAIDIVTTPAVVSPRDMLVLHRGGETFEVQVRADAAHQRCRGDRADLAGRARRRPGPAIVRDRGPCRRQAGPHPAGVRGEAERSLPRLSLRPLHAAGGAGLHRFRRPGAPRRRGHRRDAPGGERARARNEPQNAPATAPTAWASQVFTARSASPRLPVRCAAS